MGRHRQIINVLLREDLYHFTHKVFVTLHPGEQLVPNWHVELMCRELQDVAEGKSRRLLITVPPRHVKSICTSVALVAWLLGRHPHLKVIVASYGQDLATSHARDFRKVIESPWYQRLFPAMRIDPKRNTGSETMTTLRGGRKAVSLGGPVTGFGADLLIIDDMMKAADARLESERQRVQDYYEQTLFSRLNDKQAGRIIAIQQRLHEDDLAGYLINGGNFRHINLPAIAEKDETHALYYGRQHVRRKGEALFRRREPLKALENIRKEVGSFVFSSQYQQNPVPPDGNRIRWEWFQTYEDCPPRNHFQMIVQSWDTAVTAEPTSDYSVCTTWGYREGNWYLLDVMRERLEYPALKRRIVSMRETWRPEWVLIENASSGTPLIQEFRDERLGQLVVYQPLCDKETRLAAQTAKLEQRKFFVPAEAPWLDAFRHELLAFPNGRYDDQVDSMAQFLEWIGSRSGLARQERLLNGGRPVRRRRPQSRRY